MPTTQVVALASLRTNAPIVPLAARTDLRLGRPHVAVALGRPFYPETSSVPELMDHVGAILRRLAPQYAVLSANG